MSKVTFTLQVKFVFSPEASTYGFEHIASSPYWSRSNGKAEAAVHDAKSALKKSHDVYLALLNIRNTPPRGYSFSPAQRLMGRRTRGYRSSRSTLPLSENLLKPEPADPSTVSSEIKPLNLNMTSMHNLLCRHCH